MESLIKKLFKKAYLTDWHGYPNKYDRLVLVENKFPFDVMRVATKDGNVGYYPQADVWIGDISLLPPEVKNKHYTTQFNTNEYPLYKTAVIITRERGTNQSIKDLAVDGEGQVLGVSMAEKYADNYAKKGYLAFKLKVLLDENERGLGLSNDEVYQLVDAGVINVINQ